jgi:sulfur relay (sulfurtransferase) complex TusBCD TusD component (DsrE family)
MYHKVNLVEICMVGSVAFEVIALSMFLVYENKVTVNGCKFCTLRRGVILKPHM